MKKSDALAARLSGIASPHFGAPVRFSNAEAARLKEAAGSYARMIELYRAGRIPSYADWRDYGWPGVDAKMPEHLVTRIRKGRGGGFESEMLSELVLAVACAWRDAGGIGNGFHYDPGQRNWSGPLVALLEELIQKASKEPFPSRHTLKKAIEGAWKHDLLKPAAVDWLDIGGSTREKS